MVAGLGCRNAHGHVASDDRDLGLEVDAPGFVAGRYIVARPEEGIGATLVHERIGPEAFRHLGAARPADELHVIDVGRAVRPLVSARQWRRTGALVELPAGQAVGELGCEFAQPRLDRIPVIERLLQGWGNVVCGQAARQVVGDDDEAAVAAVPERGELHRGQVTGCRR